MHMFSFYLSSFCIHQRTKPCIVRLFHIDGILECTNKGKHCQTKNNLKESENVEWKRLANAFNRTNTLMLHISSWTIAEKNVNWNTSFRCSTYCWCNETNHLFFKQNYSVLDFSFTLYWFKTFFMVWTIFETVRQWSSCRCMLKNKWCTWFFGKYIVVQRI